MVPQLGQGTRAVMPDTKKPVIAPGQRLSRKVIKAARDFINASSGPFGDNDFGTHVIVPVLGKSDVRIKRIWVKLRYG